ncbi:MULTISPECIES: hypothetical protein [Pectobacterium]|uniref:Uncharacterized protein n=1 Tax=Pectobacterium aquaticum TaxID=2204145 RepID=A0AA93AIF4_9GAMM|nr:MULTISPECIES: hypothetical protein [Pectobacterium]MCL6401916.1 hypothetical protein [Pectobacterium carotovorum subsp. carotovorum]RRO05030.1 hypothetical protein DMB85_017965 [Pectobacterium aquaticum]RRO11300.1 hypothetical protein DMB84_020095 [Pectobacterium aquaticum]GKW34874.1 hypothetical protein PEC730217_36540 [Pectobacterium carotovorum subsp. carotovorum]
MRTVTAPERICIHDINWRSKTLDFLNGVETLFVIKKESIIIDLSGVGYASAAASLLFFAIINRAYFLTQINNEIRFLFPKKSNNEKGHRYIVRTGLARALLSNTLEKLDELTSEKVFFQSSVDPDKHTVTTLDFLSKTANFTKEQLYLLSMGIGEAMLNVSHHAYETVGRSDFTEQLVRLGGKRWWQCSWYDPEEGKAVFIICDLGIGIAKSYTSLKEGSHDHGINETSLVREALSCGRSKYDGAGRGNGSEDIKRPVGQGCTENETLLVLSGNSQYYYTSATTEPLCYHLKEYIPGTLIEWSLVTRRKA